MIAVITRYAFERFFSIKDKRATIISKKGSEKSIAATQLKILSISLSWNKPARDPRITPIKNEEKRVMMETLIVFEKPTSALLSMSRPSSSVPHKYVCPGEINRWARSIWRGSCGALLAQKKTCRPERNQENHEYENTSFLFHESKAFEFEG